MLRRLEKKQTSQGKFSAGRSKQCFGSQLCLKFLLLFWNTPKDCEKKATKNVDSTLWLKGFEAKCKLPLPPIALFPNFGSHWFNCGNLQIKYSFGNRYLTFLTYTAKEEKMNIYIKKNISKPYFYFHHFEFIDDFVN